MTPETTPHPPADAPAERATTRQPLQLPGRSVLRSPGFKFFLIAVLTVILLVPLFLVWALVSERQDRADEVAATIAREWGGAQSVIGPILAVPFKVVRTLPAEGAQPARVVETRRTVYLLPERIDILANAATETRRISIFETPVYAADVSIKAQFGPVDRSVFGSDPVTIEWDRAAITFAIGDLSGLETAEVALDGKSMDLRPGAGVPVDHLPGAISASAPAAAATGGDAGRLAAGFGITAAFRMKGTGQLAFAPIGRQSEIAMAADWPHPGFTDFALPSQREIGADGFSATWRIPFLARSFPQGWIADADGWNRLGEHRVGVSFLQSVDFYALVERALKYGLMFIAAVFGIVFVLEILSPARIHPVQYTLVGLILVFFYVLLLALAEQIGFATAYAGAAGATTLVISAFIGMALASGVRAIVAAAALGVIFGLLYLILRLEDVALLAGACFGFAALSAALFATRRVDWSGNGSGPAPAA